MDTKDDTIADLQAALESAKLEVSNRDKQHKRELATIRSELEGDKQDLLEEWKRGFEKEKQELIEQQQAQLTIARARADQRLAEIRADYEKLLRTKEKDIQEKMAVLKVTLDKTQEELAQQRIQTTKQQDLNAAVFGEKKYWYRRWQNRNSTTPMSWLH